MIERAVSARVPFAWVAADEAYGDNGPLRTWLEQQHIAYVLAVARDHRVPAGVGRTVRADELAARLPRRAWQQLSAGDGAKGHRWYDWAWVTISNPGPGHRCLLIRRNRSTGELAFYHCYSPQRVTLAALVKVAGLRWTIEMVFTQLAKRAVRPVGGGREHVADLDLAVGDDHAVDEQLGQQPALLEGGGGQPGPDGLAECLDPVGDGAEFQLLPGRGIQLALLGEQRAAAAVQVLALAVQLGKGDDLGEVGVQQPLLLALQLAQGLADGGLPGLEFLGQPGAALGPGQRAGDLGGVGQQRAQVGPDQLVELPGGDVAGGAALPLGRPAAGRCGRGTGSSGSRPRSGGRCIPAGRRRS